MTVTDSYGAKQTGDANVVISAAPAYVDISTHTASVHGDGSWTLKRGSHVSRNWYIHWDSGDTTVHNQNTVDDGSLTYLWEWDKQSGDSQTGDQVGLVIESPTSAETIIDGTIKATAKVDSVHWKCTITDMYGNILAPTAGANISA